MIRAAAKNHADVTVVVDPEDYGQLVEALSGGQSAEAAAAFRKRLAWKAFQHTATYDSTVAEWLWSQVGQHPRFPSLPTLESTTEASQRELDKCCTHPGRVLHIFSGV